MSFTFNNVLTIPTITLLVMLPGAPAWATATTTENLIEQDTLLSAALSRTSHGPLYTYDVHYDSAELQAYFTVNPSRERGRRITVSTPEKEQWTLEFAAQLMELDEDADTDLWCSQFSVHVPRNARRTDETATTVTYTFTPTPEDEDDARFFPYLTGTLVVDRNDPAILGFSMTADAAFSPGWLGTITQFAFKAECERIDDGRTRVSSISSHIEGRFVLKDFSQLEQWNVTAIHAASP